MKLRNDIRNIAIIAHVDHGKTTLVDGLLKQSGVFRENQQVAERVMDSNDLERERGITILSKNTSVKYGDTTINIIDTPGHADFGGEVERILKMVSGVLLLVDAYDGPMPQTRFVLSKALGLNLQPIVVINKIDRQDSRTLEVEDQILELFIELGASAEQLDFPVIYASAREGYALENPNDKGKDLRPLLDAIVKHIPAPLVDLDSPLQMLISSMEYDDFVGKIAIGRIERGRITVGQQAMLCKFGSSDERQIKVTGIYKFTGINRTAAAEVTAGDIAALTGAGDFQIGDTICDPEHPEPLPFVNIDEPTVRMTFSVNDSPFAGKEGTYVSSRHIRERLFTELMSNISLDVKEGGTPDSFDVSGRGELHLSILIETMRRQGYEFQVSKPRVIMKEIDGALYEPVEQLTVELPGDNIGIVMEKLGRRKAELTNMTSSSGEYTRLEFEIPARGLIGYRSEFLTDTRGNGIMNHIFHSYQPYKGEMPSRQRGSLVAWEMGESITYGLYNAQERGILFIGPGVQIYEGMIVGENARAEDITVNVCKRKHATNMRASGSDDALRLVTPRQMSLEQCLEFIGDDELVEVTPLSIRLRKKILDTGLRAKSRRPAHLEDDL